MTGRPSLAALALLLFLAAPARALNKGQTGSHTHDSANHGGSTLLPATLSVSGTTSLAGGTTVAQLLNIGVNGTAVIDGSLEVRPGAKFVINPASGTLINISGEAIWAKSIDGATQSSGCVVAVTASATQATAIAQFTSTTTILDRSSNFSTPGVLLETCAPGAFCRVGIRGIYRVFDDDPPGTSVAATRPSYSATRCKVSEAGLTGTASFGSWLGASGATTTNASDASIFIALPEN